MRKFVRRILGKSREDILKEEWDKQRIQGRRLHNLRDRFQKRRRYRLRTWRKRRIEDIERERAEKRQRTIEHVRKYSKKNDPGS